MVRRLIVGLIVLASVAALKPLVYHPYHCNILKKRIESSVLRVIENEVNPVRAASIAHANLKTIQRCLRFCPADVDLYAELAANLRILRRHEDAIRAYQDALKYDRRPEIYFNLGMTQLEATQREAAISNLIVATRFNPHIDQHIRDYSPDIADEVARRRDRQAL